MVVQIEKVKLVQRFNRVTSLNLIYQKDVTATLVYVRCAYLRQGVASNTTPDLV
jgi:hypothetical protein